MDYNENFERQVKVAPNCRFDEGQALQEHYRDCVKQWLEAQKSYVKGSQIDSLIDLLIARINCENLSKEGKQP